MSKGVKKASNTGTGNSSGDTGINLKSGFNTANKSLLGKIQNNSWQQLELRRMHLNSLRQQRDFIRVIDLLRRNKSWLKKLCTEGTTVDFSADIAEEVFYNQNGPTCVNPNDPYYARNQSGSPNIRDVYGPGGYGPPKPPAVVERGTIIADARMGQEQRGMDWRFSGNSPAQRRRNPDTHTTVSCHCMLYPVVWCGGVFDGNVRNFFLWECGLRADRYIHLDRFYQWVPPKPETAILAEEQRQ
jgi:hypothetical protein